MLLRIYNKTSEVLSYVSGAVVVPANGYIDVPDSLYNAVQTDPNVRHDLTVNRIDVSDVVTRYGNNDGIKYLDYMAGLRDSYGYGITSTLVTKNTEDHQALDVNVVSDISFTQSPVPSSNVNTVIHYQELPNVASGATSTILTYTVPSGKQAILQRILVGGENVAKFQTNYNSSPIATKRTYFQNLNEEFNFIENSNNGFLMQAGDVVTITVLQTRPWSANFESTIQVVEIA